MGLLFCSCSCSSVICHCSCECNVARLQLGLRTAQIPSLLLSQLEYTIELVEVEESMAVCSERMCGGWCGGK